MNDIRVVAVLRCECGEAGDARALLRPAGGGKGVRVRVEDRTARALAAELNDAPCPEAALIDLLAAALQAGGSTLTGVRLEREGEDAAIGAALRVRTGGVERKTPALVDTALLVACRLRLPIRVEPRPAAEAGLPAAVSTTRR